MSHLTSTSAYGWSGATLPPSGMVYRTNFPGLGLVSWLGSTCKRCSSAGFELNITATTAVLLAIMCHVIEDKLLHAPSVAVCGQS